MKRPLFGKGFKKYIDSWWVPGIVTALLGVLLYVYREWVGVLFPVHEISSFWLVFAIQACMQLLFILCLVSIPAASFNQFLQGRYYSAAGSFLMTGLILVVLNHFVPILA